MINDMIKITYVNRSMNQDLPKIFLSLKNEIPTFDALKDIAAWRVIENVGRGSSCTFDLPIDTEVSASRNDHTCQTVRLNSTVGEQNRVVEDETGITIQEDGSAGDTRVPRPKLYWGLAFNIREGEPLESADIVSDSLFEQDLEGVTEVTVGLYGNAEDGYQFRVDSWK